MATRFLSKSDKSFCGEIFLLFLFDLFCKGLGVTCSAHDGEGLPAEEGVCDAGDGGSKNGLGRAQLLVGELTEQGAEGEGGGEAGEKDEARGGQRLALVGGKEGIHPVGLVVRTATPDVGHDATAELAAPRQGPAR